MPTHHVLKPADRPMAEVLIDGVWRPAEVRMWIHEDDGTWSANVSWSSGVMENHLDTFPADQLRSVDEHSDARPPTP